MRPFPLKTVPSALGESCSEMGARLCRRRNASGPLEALEAAVQTNGSWSEAWLRQMIESQRRWSMRSMTSFIQPVDISAAARLKESIAEVPDEGNASDESSGPPALVSSSEEDRPPPLVHSSDSDPEEAMRDETSSDDEDVDAFRVRFGLVLSQRVAQRASASS